MRTRDRRGPAAIAALVFLLGTLATGGVTYVIAGKERRSATLAIERQADLAAVATGNEVRRYLDTVDTLAAALASHDRLTPDAFARATSQVPAEGLAGATAVVFVVPAGGDDVGAVQQRWRAEGAAGLTLSPASGFTRHDFTVYGRPLDGLPPVTDGHDLAVNADVVDVLDAAARIGKPAMSNVSLVARDTAGEQRRTLSIAAPVDGADGRLRGWVLLGLRGEGFFGGALGEALQHHVTATLSAPQLDGGLLPLAVVHRVALPGESLHSTRDLDIAGRRWRLDVGADPRDLPGAYTDRPLLTATGGGLLTLLVTALVYLLATRRVKAMRLVEEATTHLREAGREARDQAALQQAILTSLGEGVTVFGADGRVLLQNPAARELLGTAQDAEHLEDWPAHYGAYLADRLTPFPPADLPMVKALRGLSVDRVEMVIRNATHPDGILVSVSARPLDRSGGGPRGAVAVLHDITDLRRYETELAQFAAVVAHDLKSPLTAVHGFAAVAADSLPPAPAPQRPDTARAAVERVRQGATRMRAIIDDLLAYTTARDAPLNLTDVDLREIVDAVVAERTAPAEHALLATPPPTPCVRIGALPVIQADPGLLRLVVDNLVGNAVKYTPVGRTPEIEITAHTDGAGTRFEVADRGVGIPDADKARVFESFYRVRPVDYGGTGLGLAICRRIVERHGGSIVVEDNPGGGTRFCVFLPVVGVAAQAPPVSAVRRAGPGDVGWERLMRPADTVRSGAPRR